MDALGYWLAVMGLGVLHGLSPTTGWTFAAAVVHLRRCGRLGGASAAGCAGLAAWCFAASALHGAGLMLLPAWSSLCATGPASPGTGAGGLLTAALTAFVLHTAAMLVTTLAMAMGASRALRAGAAALRRLPERLRPAVPSARAAQGPHQV